MAKLYVKFPVKTWKTHNSPKCFQSNDDYVEVSNILNTYKVFADGTCEISPNRTNKITIEGKAFNYKEEL